MAVCSVCGAENEADARFAKSFDGSPAAPEEALRESTTSAGVYWDVVESTALGLRERGRCWQHRSEIPPGSRS
jgi:hypothetical protein